MKKQSPRKSQSQELKRAKRAWRVMKRRCLEPGFKDFPRYGGSGILIAPQWLESFEQFLADVGLPPTLDHWLGRLDTAAHYVPGNVVWTLRTPQMNRRKYCRKVIVQGHPRDAEVIARSDDMLARRIKWATGMEVRDLFPMAALEGVAMVDEATTKPRAIRASDDLHHGTKTAEPGRTCSQCDRLSVNGMCMASEDSQINRPAANVLRRCKAFTPLWGSYDGRNAAQLWPEIVGAK